MESDDFVVNKVRKIDPVQRARKTYLKQYDTQYYDVNKNVPLRKTNKNPRELACQISKEKIDCEI